MIRGLRKRAGAGYSIEAILAALILFTFAMNAVQVPDSKDWSGLQREIAARDISFVLKETGDLETFLKNSDTGALRTAATTLSDTDISVSGTVENLPINEMRVGFHKMPDKIFWNQTVEVQADDFCYGDLEEIQDRSETEIRRTANSTGTMEDKYGVRLYFADNDPSIPGGFNGETDYDSIYVDNGTRCVFRTEEGPYYNDEIFYWGNRTDDRPGNFFDFKRYDNTLHRFNFFQADNAVRFRKTLEKPVNGIKTRTAVNTFNFTTRGLKDLDILVFSESESLEKIQENDQKFKEFAREGSALFLMNLTQSDMNYDIMQDIGFEWFDLPYTNNPSEYDETFSDYEDSEEIETYFRGLEGDISKVSMGPGGKVISGQAFTATSREDLLFARNTGYDTSDLDGDILFGDSWTEINTGEACRDTQTTFQIYMEAYEVRNIDLSRDSGNCGQIRGLMVREDGEWRGPFLEDEVIRIDGRRYVPRIESSGSARLVFAGSSKVELVNHREVFENMTGQKIARAAYEKNYSDSDRELLATVMYWLRGDTVRFEGGAGATSLSTTIPGGISENVYMPYKVKMRWGG
ncbi:hypothetical protein ACK3SF_02110 [Candidatus Nanosalina sp. VS9-1]|uniref:hypothetical protein n=1 Tax=Candidatus Nanosalina sp. VS9-1 TaxID=3388566 RepID=UPI0039E15862